jgi:hypothetical protein
VSDRGEELGAWAREHGVDGRLLNLWRVNLERRGVRRVRGAAPKLVELVVAPGPVVGPRAPFVLRIGGVDSRSATSSMRRRFAGTSGCSSHAEPLTGRRRQSLESLPILDAGARNSSMCPPTLFTGT